MTEETLEKNLREFDYSVFSKVRESLLEEILRRYDAPNFQFRSEEILTDEELDYAAAAGNPNLKGVNNNDR